jgi:hypothetical protein
MVVDSRVCIVCGKFGASGKWGLCPTCRRRLIEESAKRRSAMVSEVCLGCNRRLRQPGPGRLYCVDCRNKWGIATPSCCHARYRPRFG